MYHFFSIPNIFSYIRVLLAACCIVELCAGCGHGWWAFWALSLAVITDLLDGYYARRLNLVTKWGTFLDPIADKILVLGVLLTFWHQEFIVGWAVGIVVARDLVVTFLRCKLILSHLTLQTSKLAKWKTVMQFFVLYLLVIQQLLFKDGAIPWWYTLSLAGSIYGMVAATVYSGIDYVIRYGSTKYVRPLSFSSLRRRISHE